MEQTGSHVTGKRQMSDRTDDRGGAERRTLLHISDLHFGPPYVPKVGEALLQMAPTLNPDVVVVSGDLTQRAKREQFAAARDFLDQLPSVPRVVVPGNHDVPLYRVRERLTDPYRYYRKFISEELEGVLDHKGLVIAALNTTAPRRSITNGRVRLEQLDFCAQAFQQAPEDAVRIVVAHHHFAPAPDYVRDQVLPKAKRALDRFVRMKVDMILGGHLHRSYIGNSLDVYPGADRDYGIIIVQCGTSTSRRGRGKEREKNTFNVIQIDRDGMIHITHYFYFSDLDDFAPVSRHIFSRPGQRFVETRSPVVSGVD